MKEDKIMEKPEALIVNGKRLDGRAFGDVRPYKIIAGYLEKADGSAYLECGNTKVVAGVYGPRNVHPRHEMEQNRAIVRCRYDMASFSVDGERKRPGQDRRSVEISKVSSEALEAAIFIERFPKTAIDVFIEVIQADASTRVAGITAASVALADAGVPMRDLVASCSFGKLYGTQDGSDTEVVAVDMNKAEDNWGLSDVAFAYMPNLKQVVLMQMDGRMTHPELSAGMKMGINACTKIYEYQTKALRDKYIKKQDGGAED